MRRLTWRRIVAATIMALTIAALETSHPIAVLAEPSSQERFLGFHVGEERRYVLEPDASFADGDSAIWIIALESVAADGGSATFRLHHERRMQLGTLVTDPEQRVVSEVVSQAELIVDAYGNPEEILLVTNENLPGIGRDEYAVRYAREGDGFKKEVRTEEGRWSFEVPVLTEGAFDEDTAGGAVKPGAVFAFSPSGLTCLASGYAVTQVERVLMRNRRGSGGGGRIEEGQGGGRDRPRGEGAPAGGGRDRPRAESGPSGRGRDVPIGTRPGTGGTIIPPAGSGGRLGGSARDFADASTPSMGAPGSIPDTANSPGTTTNTSAAGLGPMSCEVEPLFANPGLLSLIMPTVWEAAIGALDLRFLTPLGPALFPGEQDGEFPVSIGRNGMVSLSGNPLDWFGDNEDNVGPKSPAANFDDYTLELGDRATIDVNGRSMEAWNVDVSGGMGTLQVDDEGKVLRTDLAPDTTDGMVARWIRILFASEY